MFRHVTIRALAVLFACLFTTHASKAQTEAAPPDLEVVKFSWSKERIDWERNPFGGTNESFHEMQFRARAERRAARASPAEQKQAEAEAKAAEAIVRSINEKPSKPPRYAFLYKLSVRNNGTKPIKEIDWDYVFTDAWTGQEAGRRQFTSEERIAPGKSKELSFLIPTPPAQVISVHSLNGKKERDALRERIIILRILYADDTSWESP